VDRGPTPGTGASAYNQAQDCDSLASDLRLASTDVVRLCEKYGLVDPTQNDASGFRCQTFDPRAPVRAQVAATEPMPIDSSRLDYYRQAFPTAALASAQQIPDPITEGDINASYLKIYDRDQRLLGYLREVATSTGCNGVCLPLEFALALGPDHQFVKLLAPHPLTKLGHRKFTDNDYAKMDGILRQNPGSFANASEPADLVDAVTSATKRAYKDDVVATAALTSFRIYQYEKQTIGFLTAQS